MTVYGPLNSGGSSGNIAFTGFSPTLGGDTGNSDALIPATSGNVKFDGATQNDRVLSLFTARNRVFYRLMQALIGATSGGTATENRTRVQAAQAVSSINTNGGAIPIETVALINRATTAQDIVNLQDAMARTVKPSSYVADASGNGGGGKSGF